MSCKQVCMCASVYYTLHSALAVLTIDLFLSYQPTKDKLSTQSGLRHITLIHFAKPYLRQTNLASHS